jgi:signal transduction histidine kinase
MAALWVFLRRPSLLRRLAVILLGAALASTAVGAALGVATLLWSRDGELDAANGYLARMIAVGISGEPDPVALLARVARFEAVAEAANRDDGLSGDLGREAFQVIRTGQRLVYRSPKAPAAAFPWLGPGVHRVRVDGRSWSVSSALAPDGLHQVHVGTPMGDQLRLFRILWADMGWMLLAPMLLASVLALLAARIGLRPLSRLATALRRRPAEALEPIEPPVVHEETRPLLAAINHQFAQARRHLEHQRAFIADAAHELRTPLAVIATWAHRLATADTPEERRSAQADLQIGLDRSAQLIGQLLTLARLEAPTARVRRRTDLEALLADITRSLAPVLLDAGCELGLTSPGPTFLEADPSGLRSAVENLVRNAGQYAGPGATVDLILERREGEVLVQVRDDGPGVPAPYRALLAEPFYRVPGTRASGSGLGLAIARRVAEDHGGTLELACGDRGFTATLRLPGSGPESSGA